MRGEAYSQRLRRTRTPASIWWLIKHLWDLQRPTQRANNQRQNTFLMNGPFKWICAHDPPWCLQLEQTSPAPGLGSIFRPCLWGCRWRIWVPRALERCFWQLEMQCRWHWVKGHHPGPVPPCRGHGELTIHSGPCHRSPNTLEHLSGLATGPPTARAHGWLLLHSSCEMLWSSTSAWSFSVYPSGLALLQARHSNGSIGVVGSSLQRGASTRCT